MWLNVAPCSVQLDSDILAAHAIKFQTTNITYKLHYAKAEFSATITEIRGEVVELIFGGSNGKVEVPDVLIGLQKQVSLSSMNWTMSIFKVISKSKLNKPVRQFF